MSREIEFDRLFVFDMANNHMGDVKHGLRIIRDIKKATEGTGFSVGFKLQYRELDSFIHPDYKDRKDIKYVKRFSETRLKEPELKQLKDEMDKQGFITVCTPFDEPSVDLIEKHGFDIIKVASCSFTDWPLLERIARTDKPIIASTAGASIEDIDKVVAFLEHRCKKFCIMHCVGEYPTKNENLQLNQIRLLKKRYKDVPVGFSTHESPDLLDSVKIAVGEGAAVFERHVGVKTEKYDLNAYSATPEQVKAWLAAAKEAYAMAGVSEGRRFTEKEKSDLRGLQRGVFAKVPIKKGELIEPGNVFLAIPVSDGQVVANDLSKYKEFFAQRDINPKEPVMFGNVSVADQRARVSEIVKKVKEVLAKSNVVLPNKVDAEISHHYGIDKFEQWGAVIISVINREYCKKLIILLPGQKHPTHSHKKKEETFHVLYGSMTLNLNGVDKSLKAGDMITVERNAAHSFCSDTGVVFEEVSTTHYANDSFYEDERVTKNKRRKTELTYWLDW